jgi:hypothetical protein
MEVTATEAINYVGDFSTGAIRVDIAKLGAVLAKIMRSVNLTGDVVTGDLNVYKSSSGQTPNTIVSAVMNGSKIFDAVYWFLTPNRREEILKVRPEGAEYGTAFLSKQKTSLMALGVYCLIRGGYPTVTVGVAPTNLPAFLPNVLKYTGTTADLSTSISSFNIGKVPINWIRYISFNTLPQEVAQRLSIGVAGYRNLMPFRVYDCKANCPEATIRAFNLVRTFANKPASWEVFSATRSTSVINAFGALNKTLDNLMLECFTEEQIVNMMSPNVKMLFRRPVADPRANKWRSWTEETFAFPLTYIFQASRNAGTEHAL